jgi:hypothetical protein
MVGNGSGWDKVGTVKHANTGAATDSIGFHAGPEGYVALEVGEYVDARTKAQKTAINSGLNSSGWIAHTLADCRIHADTGAVIQIERNFWHNEYKPGAYKVRARFIRIK